MDQVLKITSVLADPTRYEIYQYITRKHQEVTVQEIADAFHIHPNVARLHLTKLEDVNMLVSETKKTGKGGRPSRLYRLSDVSRLPAVIKNCNPCDDETWRSRETSVV